MDRHLPIVIIASVLAIGALAILSGSVPIDADAEPTPRDGGDVAQNVSEQRSPGTQLSWRTRLPAWLRDAFLGVLIVAVAGAVLLVRRTLSRPAAADAARTTAPSDDDADESSLADVADAAGRAADRLQRQSQASRENEVYRAWREMTGALGVPNRRAKTPTEFETAAIRAGMDEADVRELTALFERVRYGGEQPTQADEQRAVALLRRIESAYGSDAE